MSGRDLRDVVERALAAAGHAGRAQWVVWRRRGAPLDVLEEFAAPRADAFVYVVPEAELAIGACDPVAQVESSGPDRFTDVRRAMADVAGRCHFAGEPLADPIVPLWLGGFGFRDADPRGPEWRGFPAARWTLPGRLFMQRGDESWHGVARRVVAGEPAAQVSESLERALQQAVAAQTRVGAEAPDGRAQLVAATGASEHRARVREALAAIGSGELEKVVVARALDVNRTSPFDPRSLLTTLRQQHPLCAIFGVQRDGAWLLGATPERLLRREDRQLEATALAGSAARGRDPEEDAALRRELVESKKEQSEHAIVVRSLRADLAALGLAPRVPEAPEVLGLGGVQHLCTRLRAELPQDGPDLLELAGRVHPTAAVAGAPRAAALAWIDSHEQPERGWYAGLVGWLSATGEGELSAALRCALLRDGHARLYAGGGIVAGSLPEAELRETRLKWNALLPALLEL